MAYLLLTLSLFLLQLQLHVTTASLPFPSCLTANTTWETSLISGINFDIASPELCQQLCVDDGSCQGVTWLTAHSPVYALSCTTFSSLGNLIPCTECVSGPARCSCTLAGECEAEDGNIIDMFSEISSELECEGLCLEEGLCEYYTYFGDTNPLRHICILFSSCNTLTSSCGDCFTSAKECDICSFENTQPDGSCLVDDKTGLVIVGGQAPVRSAEFWAPGPEAVQCLLPSFSRNMDFPTVDIMQGKIIACYEYSCDELTKTGWEPMQSTVHNRGLHTSAITSQGILLVGGQDSDSTTELIPVDGGESIESFTLRHPRADHCSIQISDSTIILTGGFITNTYSLVTEYSGQWADVTERELPSLNTGRSGHACGMYMVGDNQMLLVTGGTTDRNQDLSSTEVMEWPSGVAWRETSPLPSPCYGLKGRKFRGVLHVMGGYADELNGNILSWDGDSEVWAVVGHMQDDRMHYGVTEVPLTAVAEFCSAIP